MIRFNGSNNGTSYKINIETNLAYLFFTIIDLLSIAKAHEEKSKHPKDQENENHAC